MLLIRTLWFCSAALLGTAAMAQGTPTPTETAPSQEAALTKGVLKAMRDFKMLDFNGDGKLSRAEVAIVPKVAAAFDDADTNRDNYVSYEEVREFAVKYRAERDRQKAAQAAQPPIQEAPAIQGAPLKAE